MSETRENDSQKTPKPNQSAPIADLVCADIQRRAEHGQRKYGTKLQAHNGRNALQDAYEEALDLCHYLKQRLVEDESGLRGKLRETVSRWHAMADDFDTRASEKNSLPACLVKALADTIENTLNGVAC